MHTARGPWLVFGQFVVNSPDRTWWEVLPGRQLVYVGWREVAGSQLEAPSQLESSESGLHGTLGFTVYIPRAILYCT